MTTSTRVSKGLGNLDAAERGEVYRDVRQTLGISDTEPMLRWLVPWPVCAFC